VRTDLLEGVLHCDLIGFHTFDYARHFLSSCSLLLYGPLDGISSHLSYILLTSL
jgi:trehalose-6-phosphate synthase